MGAGHAVKLAIGRVFPRTLLVKGPRSSTPRVALTFDDGPHPENTPRVLDTLDRFAAKATFFVQGREVERFPALARELVARGHQVGNHGHSHLDARTCDLKSYMADIDRAQKAVEDALGMRIETMFRPPEGSITVASFLALAFSRYRIVFWSADSRDSFIRDPQELLAHVRSLDVGDGDVLLLHDDYGHTVRALPRLLAGLGERGLRFETILGLLSGGPSVPQGGPLS